MKIQELAIVFIIIILPISLVLSIFTQYQIQTINTQTLYDSRLTSATYDAMRAYQLNATNSTTSDLSNSKIRDIEASVATFKNSIVSTFGLDGYTEDDLNSYIPALVYTMYDGFYIYSPYENINYQYENEKDPVTGNDKVDENGNTIPDETKPTNGNGESQYGLKPYITYSCRYKKSGIDVVITYALDNYISVRGTLNGEYINESGYLVEGVTGDSIEDTVTYNGIEIGKEQLKEYLPINSAQYPDQMFPYIKLNGTKYYQINDHQIVYISNGTIAVQCDKNQSEAKFNVYSNMINNNTLAKQYYTDAKKFTEWFKNKFSSLTYQDAYDEDGNKIWPDDTRQIFEFNNPNGIHIEYELSNFNQHRLQVIRYTIEKNLEIAISNYNEYSGVSNVFQMPELKEYEWDYLTHNISLISFLQGLSIGGKIYNGYTLVTNSESKEVVLEQDIYILGKDVDTNQLNYYKIGDKGLEDGSVIISNDYSASTISAGRLNLDFNRNSITYKDQSYYFYPIKDYRASYNSIVMQNNMTTYDDIYTYVNNQSLELKQAFYTALGRERGSLSVEVDVLSTDYINITVVDELNGTSTTQGVAVGTIYGNSGILETPTRKGYRFDGWWTEKEGGVKVSPNDVCNYSEDTTFYAHWEKIKYTLYFDIFGDREKIDSRPIYIDQKFGEDPDGNSYPLPDNVEVPGRTFEGWYKTPTYDGERVKDEDVFTECINLTLHAKFTNNIYTVTFDANGGNVSPASKNVTYSENYEQLPTPSRTGYDFAGWYTEAVEGEEVTADTSYNIAGNSTLYAHWIAKKYTLSFDNNVGGSLVGTKTVTYDQPYGTLMNTSRQGYTFTGWYTAAGVKVNSTDIYKVAGDSTLYAHWTANTYTVTYNANGGSVSPGSKTVTYKGTYGSLSTPTRSGYKFLGWYTAASGGTQITSGTIYNTIGNSTIYAHWQSLPNQTASFDTGWCYNNNYGPPNYGYKTFETRGNAGDWSEYLYISYNFTCINNTINDGGSDIGFYIEASYDGSNWATITSRSSNSSDRTSHTDTLSGTYTNYAKYRYFRIKTAQVSYHNSGCNFRMYGSFTARAN